MMKNETLLFALKGIEGKQLRKTSIIKTRRIVNSEGGRGATVPNLIRLLNGPFFVPQVTLNTNRWKK
jgi:hypothetical protein